MEHHFDFQGYYDFIDQQAFDKEFESEEYFWNEFIQWYWTSGFIKEWERWKNLVEK